MEYILRYLKARVLATCLIALLGAAAVGAYDYTGFKWPGTTTQYSVNVASCTSVMNPTAFLADVQASGTAWHDQTNANFEFMYGGTTAIAAVQGDNASIVFCTTTPDASGYIAETHCFADGNGALVDCDTWLHLGNAVYTTSDQSCLEVVTLDIMTHEFGHWLALNHSADPNATMASGITACSTKDRTLYSDDINAIESVYGLREAPPPPPPPPPTACVTDGVTYALGAQLSFTGGNGPAAAWQAARTAEGWTLINKTKLKNLTTVVMKCGPIDGFSVRAS